MTEEECFTPQQKVFVSVFSISFSLAGYLVFNSANPLRVRFRSYTNYRHSRSSNGKQRLRYFVTSLTQMCDVDFEATAFACQCRKKNPMNLLTIRNRNIPYVFEDERYACSDDFVYIFCARESIVSVISLFLQLQRQ